MTLDLHDLTADWESQAGEICARVVAGRDGGELIQLRVDLGVMQMFAEGRPDGQRYHGLPSAAEYVRHERRLGREALQPEDWRELDRELYQFNYRRLALASLVEDALARSDVAVAKTHLRRALGDIEACLARIALARENPECGPVGGGQALRPTLVFHRGRLSVQAEVLEERYEEAVERAEQAQQELMDLLEELGLDEVEGEQDPGVAFLRDLSQRLRRDYNVTTTLRERLEAAIENEDFEAAARLRNELRLRRPGESAEGSSAPEG